MRRDRTNELAHFPFVNFYRGHRIISCNNKLEPYYIHIAFSLSLTTWHFSHAHLNIRECHARVEHLICVQFSTDFILYLTFHFVDCSNSKK